MAATTTSASTRQRMTTSDADRVRSIIARRLAHTSAKLAILETIPRRAPTSAGCTCPWRRCPSRAFDLLALGGRDLRAQQLVWRHACPPEAAAPTPVRVRGIVKDRNAHAIGDQQRIAGVDFR